MPERTGSPVDGDHVFPVRVYYEDTDAAGIVYHASYLRFAERARTEMVRATGMEQGRVLAETGLAFAVRRMEIDYRAPARLDDLLDVATRLTEIGGASLRVEQTIRRAGTVLVRLFVKLGCIDRAGRAVRLPPAIRAALQHIA
ncbi:MAG: tol-pal system-associated acyl-CoA thioesterase [Inquilinus sp.]|nr:tol-pal system-associated acyl-CoA thioesterase [Inquilinus sp.]